MYDVLANPDTALVEPQFKKERRSTLSTWFYNHGKRCARNPKMTIVYCFVLAAWACVGLINLKVDSDPQKIWVPPGSDTNLQQLYFNGLFTPFFRIEQMIFTTPDRQDNMLTEEYLLAVLDVQEELVSARDSRGTRLDDICFKPIPGKGCIVESPLNYFRSDKDEVSQATPRDIQLATACTQYNQSDHHIPCLSSIGVPVMPEVILGDISCNLTAKNPDPCGSCIPSAKAMMLTLLLEDTPHAADLAATWEKEVFERIAKRLVADGELNRKAPMDVTYMSQRSIADELSREEQQNEFVVVVSYVAMFLYISVALGKFPHPVRSRSLLGGQGIVIVMMSVLAALGLAAACGVHITMIVSEVVPFLILAIGVDNMFIIVKAYDRRTKAHGDEGIEECVAHALADVGPSITAAAASECLAFGVGATTQIPALQQFCTVAGVAVLLDYLLQITWFVAAITLDARRMQDNRQDMCFCHRVKKATATEGDFWKTVLQGEFVRRLMDTYYTPFILKPVMRPCVVITWVAVLITGCYGAAHMKLGLEQQLVLPSDSYLEGYFDMQASMGEAGPPMYVVLQDVNYTHPETPAAIDNLVNSMAQLTDVIEPPVYNWLSDYNAWYINRVFINTQLCVNPDDPQKPICDCPMILPPENSTFAERVQQYLNVSVDSTCCQLMGYCGAQYAQDVILGTDSAGDLQVLGSRLRSQHTALRNQTDFIDAMQVTQAAVNVLEKYIPRRDFPLDLNNKSGAVSFAAPTTLAPGGAAFPYSLFYVYYAQYGYIQGVAIQNLLLSVGAVFLAVLAIASGATAVVVCVCVLSIAIGIVGFIWLLNPPLGDDAVYGVDINAVSVVNLVMAVGLSVEFCVHVAAAFGAKRGTRVQRVKAAMSEMGSSVVTGITLTKFCGVAVLAWAPSRLFRMYYFRMYLGIIVLGAFHGLALLPVVLSILGSEPEKLDQDVTNDISSDDEPISGSERSGRRSAASSNSGYGSNLPM